MQDRNYRVCFGCLNTPEISDRNLAQKDLLLVTKFSKLTTVLDRGYRFRPVFAPDPL